MVFQRQCVSAFLGRISVNLFLNADVRTVGNFVSFFVCRLSQTGWNRAMCLPKLEEWTSSENKRSKNQMSVVMRLKIKNENKSIENKKWNLITVWKRTSCCWELQGSSEMGSRLHLNANIFCLRNTVCFCSGKKNKSYTQEGISFVMLKVLAEYIIY